MGCKYSAVGAWLRHAPGGCNCHACQAPDVSQDPSQSRCVFVIAPCARVCAVKLYEAYNSAAAAPVYKNMVRFKGDHNHPRPSFFYSSVCCFFHQQLKLDQVLLGGNPVRHTCCCYGLLGWLVEAELRLCSLSCLQAAESTHWSFVNPGLGPAVALWTYHGLGSKVVPGCPR